MKRGFISVSLVMILTILNIIFISLATQSLRYRASNANAIRNRGKIVYYKSYIDIDEEILKKTFREVLIMYTDYWEKKKGIKFNEFMREKVNFKNIDVYEMYSKYGLCDYKASKIEFVIGKDSNMYFTVTHIIKDGSVHINTYYRINKIKFDDEDEKYIEEKNIDSLEKKYLDRLIDDRKSSIGW